ncbi:hypothetical protein TREMEDRAFT_70300 [Tremella mesenterica DSM 1558]|uniref:uncharacterized protein n=1 Tax=Tremella mesenterica (strain ATCC 24925 / CBS 8224 / DSM 1558 / NBRC 9311 / NRRL Y-6157 / RJB 2259-6 / UBC 559-6) TaxID=578456 RepID=UPI00032D10B3|nr:uncharacterized protein TREMEDRAFT_70300 [Tremella mesenterica DSM 1558]EIW66021.1 hypothetical protein TREMEDRAFT_70300 [Tremella mesenterica DSM 1558]
MYALHQPLLPSSSVHFSLFLPNFTPSTIYPLPSPHTPYETPPIKVLGNVVVAGGQDLRVFEIREQQVPIPESPREDGVDQTKVEKMDEDMADDIGDNFFDTGFRDRAPVNYETTRRLHLLCQHTLHGWITGLAPLRTIESSVDGLDRLLVSFKDAKMALLEWSRGDIATVSLHTYERCQQMVTGDLQFYTPLLRSDPLSRLAVLTLPEDSLAILPVLQEQSDLDPLENFTKDAPYSPSFVLSLADVAPTIKNLQDLLFLPGFHSPTLAVLYSPYHTWAGRYHSQRDTFCLEVRTFDITAGGSYPLLTSVSGLPSDSLYIVACPAELGGVVLVTTTGLLHIDQSGRTVATSVNAWWSHITTLPCDKSSESRKISLEGSKSVFVTERDMLLVLQNGDVHQVRFEMNGRAIGAIKVDEQSSNVPAPSSMVTTGNQAIFVGCAEGDSLLANVDIKRAVAIEDRKPAIEAEAEVDWDEDLYGDIDVPLTNGATNGAKYQAITGPANIVLSPADVLTGVGKIVDMEFGIASTDEGTRTYPQLVTIGGGSKRSTFNAFRRGIPISKRRRFNELFNTESVWFLPIQRPSGQHLKSIPEDRRTTMLFSSEATQTRIFSLSAKPNPEQIGRISGKSLTVGPFFQRSNVLVVTQTEVLLLDSDGKTQQSIGNEGEEIVSASISDPYVVIRRVNGSGSMFVGDTVARQLSEVKIPSDSLQPPYQAIEVFSDTTGIYRMFEASDLDNLKDHTARSIAIRQGHQNRMQLTQDQIKRLQEEKPAISADAPSTEMAMNAARGTQWLALLSAAGRFEIRSLPDLTLVLQSDGLGTAAATFTDETADADLSYEENIDKVKQLLFCPIGRGSPRPHMLAYHQSGRLNIYEAQPRFTRDASQTPSRRSLAVRFRKVHTSLISPSSSTSISSTIIPYDNLEGQSGAFITGEKPYWIMSSEKHPLRLYGLKQGAMAFGPTTHLGSMGEYFMKIDDGCFICYFPQSLNTDLTMPCDRYEMQRTYTNVVFDPPSGHYLGATAISVPFQAYDEEGEIQLGPEGENLVPPLNERSSLELFSRGSDPWRVIDGYDFDQNENVLSMQSVLLESSSVPGGYRDFVAVGTGFDFGEDRATRGNVYIFEVVEVVPEPGQKSAWALKLRCKDPCRNPVSALGNINGYLLHSNGPKMYVKGLDFDERLMGLAFVDVMIYLTSIKVFKNFILISDMVKSIWFLSFQEDPYKFTVISKDLMPISVTSADFLVHDGHVTFLTYDRSGDIRMVDFDPANPESINGERLIVRTEYHGGSPVTVSTMIARRRGVEEEFAPQTQIICAHADGSISTFVSTKPARFRRLHFVSDQLIRNAQHVAGLNPRAFRTVRNDLVAKPLSRGILDGELLGRFAIQPIDRQREMLKQIGTDGGTVASDLQALGGFW